MRGRLLALLVIAVGMAHGDRAYAGAGIVFLAVFTAAFFSGIDIGMLMKSGALIATGLVTLLARWLFVHATRQASGGSHAA